MFRSILTISGFTFLSRLCGFLRDMLLASLLGAGIVSDAYYVALRLPNLFRQLFAEGAFNAAFIPMFAGKLETNGESEAMTFANRALGALAIALSILTLFAEIFMPQILTVLAPGFQDHPEKHELAVQLSRISFPYLVFISLAALQTGILNSHRKFAHGASAPIILNLVLIATLLLIVPHFPNNVGEVLAWAVTIAGILQMLWLTIALSRSHITLRMEFKPLAPEIRQLMRRMGPGILTGGVNQINLTIATILASFQAEAVSYLYYADRLYQLPLALIGSAIGVALLPNLTRHLRAGRMVEAEQSFNRAMEWGLFFSLPACVGLITAAYPLINVLYERGAFSAEDSAKTSLALMALASGLPAYVANKTLSAGFLAREDTKTPFRGAIIAVATDILVSISLFPTLGYVGVALGTSIAAWVNSLLLFYWLKKRDWFHTDATLRKKSIKALSLSLLMGATIFGLTEWHRSPSGSFIERALWLCLLVTAGFMIYISGAFITKMVTIAELRRK